MNVLNTEQSHGKSNNLDVMDAAEIIGLMNEADLEVVSKVRSEIANIADAVDLVARSLKNGGRLIYVGAGTSGRLGILDAVECPPTFGVSDQLIQGVIAGGPNAVFKSAEGAEDDESQGGIDLQQIGLNSNDAVMAISASGRTPYCIGALKYAAAKGAGTIALSCNKNVRMSELADISIEVDTGPEVITGSTRLKAGTAEKMVLNMISTAAMVKLGKVYKNYMVDMIVSNQKLADRSRRIVMNAADISNEMKAQELLEEASGNMKVAIVMALANVNKEEAAQLLSEHGGFVRRAVHSKNGLV
ncbi:N-acetylmuramic acid 6-phosphate etherase [Paenibacillus sp. FSL H8-0548]|uniref:N-acetylmuramic acid 6-phosphate etherase n=1 Tax=Paenibacillus sp. FSL H8-0548 TaxID=1920422 RepID=UPI002115DE78|nr:N-acetylmuramic acid 6-phosphate etherase [Paenibacillus sp. FSL H8-0548]